VLFVIATGAAKVNNFFGAADVDTAEERGSTMRHGGKFFRTLAACGLTAAALLACGTATHAQSGGSRIGGTTGGGSSMGSSGGLGGGGGSGGGSSLGSSNGFGNNSNGQFSFAGGSSFVGNANSSFAGGTSGSSFSGGSSGSFSGTSGSGSYSGGGRSFGGGASGGMSISGGVSNMNAFASSFANPLAGGLGTGSGTSSTFGMPLYNNLLTNPNKIVGTASGSSGGFIGSGGSGSLMGSASMRGGMSGGYGGTGSTNGTGEYGIFALPYASPPSPRASTAPGSPPQTGNPPTAVLPGAAGPAALTPLPARMQTNLQDLIARSDNVSAATRGGVTFGYDAGGTIVLRGTVANPAEARALEALIRFAPGVTGVRSEMTLKGQ
jgi:hypothetical protein